MTRDEMVLKLMHLAYLVDRRTDFCVFIDFSGHVQSLEIRVCESEKNWRNTVLETAFYTAYTEKRREFGVPEMAILAAKIEVLETVLRDREIPYDELDYEEIVTRTYEF